MESTDVKDPKVELLAAMALRDEAYMRDVEHVRNQSKLENVEKASELRQLRGDWKELSVISLGRGDLIVRGDRGQRDPDSQGFQAGAGGPVTHHPSLIPRDA